MLEKTQGIVLCTLPYNDHTSFVHIYTEKYGKMTFRTTHGRGKRAAASRIMMAPMTLLEMEIDYKRDREIQNIREMQPLSSPYMIAAGDPAKAAQCLFMAELLDKTIREVEANHELFSFIRQSIEVLELSTDNNPNFHLAFFIRLIDLLGFHIDTESYSPGSRFDINEGKFTQGNIYHAFYLTQESATLFYKILQRGFSDQDQMATNREERNRILDTLILYLQLHIPEMGEIRSTEILKELFVEGLRG